MERTVKIEDNLNDILESLQSDVRWTLKVWLNENAKDEVLAGEDIDTPCLNNDLDYSGAIHEAIDGAVPVYYSEIDGLWFLYKDAFIEAYENMGIGEDPTENNGMTAIYCYLNQEINEWYYENGDEMTQEICEEIKLVATQEEGTK